MDDLRLQGGIVNGIQQDIAIASGQIREVGPHLATEAHERIDITGNWSYLALSNPIFTSIKLL